MRIRVPGHTPATTHTDGSRGWVGNTRSGRTVRVTTAHIPTRRVR